MGCSASVCFWVFLPIDHLAVISYGKTTAMVFTVPEAVQTPVGVRSCHSRIDALRASMNNIKITYDGRITAWNSKLTTHRASKLPLLRQSPEWELFCLLPTEGKEEFLTSCLGSSHVANSDSVPEPAPRARRGLKGITAYGRTLIRGGAQYLEDRYGVKHLSFLTCTLPPEALAVCTPESWAEVLNRFLKSLRLHLVKGGLSPEIVGCIEVQEIRLLQESGRPPLHLHVVFQGRQIGKAWAYPGEFYQALWERACKSVWEDIQGFQSSCRVESLRSSAVSYLGKYMSKGGDVLNLCKPELLPSAWYTISTKLKAFVKGATLKLSGQAAHDLYETLYRGDQMLWARSVMSEFSDIGVCYLLAWVAQIRSRETYWEIVNSIREVWYPMVLDDLTVML